MKSVSAYKLTVFGTNNLRAPKLIDNKTQEPRSLSSALGLCKIKVFAQAYCRTHVSLVGRTWRVDQFVGADPSGSGREGK